MERQYKLDAIARSPQLNHSRQIFLHVAIILGATHRYPINGIPGVRRYEFLAGVIRRKVHKRQVHKDIKGNHLGCINDTGSVLDLLGEWHLGKAIHSGEPLTVFVHHDPILKAAEVGKPERDEDAIPSPIDLA